MALGQGPQSATAAQLSQAIRAAPPHLRWIYRAVRDFGCSHVIVPQGAGAFQLAPGSAPIIAIIGDDFERSLGPDAFDQPSLIRLVARCSQAIIMAGFAPEVYQSAASWAICDRESVIIVETRSAHELQWAAFLKKAHPDVSILHVLDSSQAASA